MPALDGAAHNRPPMLVLGPGARASGFGRPGASAAMAAHARRRSGRSAAGATVRWQASPPASRNVQARQPPALSRARRSPHHRAPRRRRRRRIQRQAEPRSSICQRQRPVGTVTRSVGAHQHEVVAQTAPPRRSRGSSQIDRDAELLRSAGGRGRAIPSAPASRRACEASGSSISSNPRAGGQRKRDRFHALALAARVRRGDARAGATTPSSSDHRSEAMRRAASVDALQAVTRGCSCTSR